MNLTTLTTFCKNHLRRLIFPRECVGCGRYDVWLCADCLDKIPIRSHLEKNQLRHQDYIDKIYIASYYANEALQKIIDLFKYHYQEDLSYPLSQVLIKFIKTNQLKNQLKDFIIFPLPLHSRRLLERGFNQSQLLANNLADKFDIRIINDNLIRTRYTKHQTLLDHADRQRNVKNIFVVRDKTNIIGKKILLLDDVVTTGASLNEAARILRQAGAVKIWALVLAKN